MAPNAALRLTCALALLSLGACIAVEAPLPAPRMGDTKTAGSVKTRTQTRTEISPDGATTHSVTQTRTTSTSRSASASVGIRSAAPRIGAPGPAVILQQIALPPSPAGGWNEFPEMR